MKNDNGNFFHIWLELSEYTTIDDPYPAWATQASILWNSGNSSKCSILGTSEQEEDESNSYYLTKTRSIGLIGRCDFRYRLPWTTCNVGLECIFITRNLKKARYPQTLSVRLYEVWESRHRNLKNFPFWFLFIYVRGRDLSYPCHEISTSL